MRIFVFELFLVSADFIALKQADAFVLKDSKFEALAMDDILLFVHSQWFTVKCACVWHYTMKC